MTVQPTTNPNSAYGTLADGVYQYADDMGEIQAIPNTRTPPYGEPVLNVDGYESPYPVGQPIDTDAEDEALHQQINGPSGGWASHGYDIGEWVNPSNPGIPNLGPVNQQPVQSGHSQIVIPNPAAEQGWGLDPAIVNSRYPHSENTNPFYGYARYRRNGSLEFNSTGIPLNGGALNIELQRSMTQRRSTVHQRLADVPASVPYSSTVPVGGSAGPLALVPNTEDEAIY